MTPESPLLVLDRDGILNRTLPREGGRHTAPFSLSEFELFPEAKLLVEAGRESGFVVIVATNQPDVAHGRLALAELEEMHRIISRELGIPRERIEVCLSADNNDPCKKPNPGMILAAAERLGLPLCGVLIGDSWKDIEAAKRAGLCSVLLCTDYNQDSCGRADYEFNSHAQIAEFLRSWRRRAA